MSLCTSCQTAIPVGASFCPACGLPVKASGAAPEASGEEPVLGTIGGLPTIGERPTGRQGANGGGAPLLADGTRFADRFTIGGTLGSGGMGVVYRAHDDLAGRDVALKLIRSEFANSEREVERLVQEGLTARDIRHENVVAVYDVGRDGTTPFISMEVVEGTSLRAWLRERSATGLDTPAAVAVAIARAVAGGLEAAHAKGVIHRDLKPENVILTAEPEASTAPLKVLDFGIARASYSTSIRDSATGPALGTPHYMAPEQVTSPNQTGPSADIYSLSVMLYEMLVGVLPQGHWQPPSGGRSDVPKALDDLVHAGLSNRPASRPQSMAEFIERLDSLGSSQWEGAGKMAMDGIENLKSNWKKNVRESLNSKWKIGAAIVAVLLIIGMMFEESDVGEGGLPAPKSLVDLSGQWHGEDGDELSINVLPNGQITGFGTLADGTSVSAMGGWSGNQLEIALGQGGMPLLGVQGVWSGGTSFDIDVYSPVGEYLETTNIRVNRAH